MAGRVLGRVGVVQVGRLLVPVLGARAAQVGTGDEGPVAPDLQLGLEDVCAIRRILDRCAAVHQEDRN